MNTRKIKARSYAKINLSLNVSGKNPEGYHLLDSITASVSLSDVVTVCERLDSRVSVSYNGRPSPYEGDSVMKALGALRSRFGDFGVDVCVEKNLPEGAGLGGSSADAAAVIALCDKLFHFGERGFNGSLTAYSVGCDVPYMLKGGYARMRGVGEQVSFLPFNLPLNLVLALPVGKVSTALCYAGYDALTAADARTVSDNDKLQAALTNGDFLKAAKECGNALTEAASRICPAIPETLKALEAAGAAASFMTGSGSGCVGLFQNGREAERAAAALEAQGRDCRALTTVPAGIEIL